MDIDIIFGLFGQAFNAVLNWFTQFANSLPGVLNAILGVFTIYTLIRLLLVPLVGQASSDIVSNVNHSAHNYNPSPSYRRLLKQSRKSRNDRLPVIKK